MLLLIIDTGYLKLTGGANSNTSYVAINRYSYKQVKDILSNSNTSYVAINLFHRCGRENTSEIQIHRMLLLIFFKVRTCFHVRNSNTSYVAINRSATAFLFVILIFKYIVCCY